MEQQRVVIEAQAGADRDGSQADRILRVGGLFAVRRFAVELISGG